MNTYFNVRPRYTGGSPAMVDREIAFRVLDEEHRSFHHANEGFYGPEKEKQAKEQGLNGIVEMVTEKGNKLFYLDLMTGLVSEKNLKPKKGQTSEKVPLYSICFYCGQKLWENHEADCERNDSLLERVKQGRKVNFLPF